MENFAKEFMVKLDGKISESDMATILQELQMFASGYDIRKKETSLTTCEPQIPECYKAYMVSKKIEGLSYESKPRGPLTGIELELVRDACRTYREKAIIEVFYSTGCRVSEMVNLSKSDVDFVKGEVKLFGKGAKHRISYINARAEVSLKKYLFSRRDENPALFVSDRNPNDRLKKTAIEKVVREIGERSGIGRRVFPHLIRHTTATDALERGMNIAEVQKILGHEKMDTTMIYTKVCQESVKHDHRRYIV